MKGLNSLVLCGVGPDCREQAPWNSANAEMRTLKRAYEAFAMHTSPLTERHTVTEPEALIRLVVDQQCKLVVPALSKAEQEFLHATVGQQCRALGGGVYHTVDGENRRVLLGDDWSALEVYGRGEFPLHKLSSIQLETVWTSFDATLVFEGESGGGNDEAPHQPLHFRFTKFDVRVRFILTAKVLRNLAKRLQQRASRKGPSQHSHSPSSMQRGVARRQQQQQRRQPQQRSSQTSDNGTRPVRQNRTSQAEASASGVREEPHTATPGPTSPTVSTEAQQQPSPAKEIALSIGVVVRFRDLKSMPSLNGKLGVCERLDDDTGRWHVRMRDSDEVKSVKPENLVAIAGHEEESNCVICLSSPASMAFVPCGHRCVCSTCAEELTGDLRRRCPQCRQPCNSIIRIFC